MSTELALLTGVSYRGVAITSPRIRDLLALLADDLRAGCGIGRLVDGLWPDEQPENPVKAVQILVSRVRSQLGADLIVTTPTGYRLRLGEDEVDAAAVMLRAAGAARCARDGDHLRALDEADAGLALWDAVPNEHSAPGDPVSVLRSDRAPVYHSLKRIRALALSRLGRAGEAIEPLQRLATERPRDEEIMLELLRAEAATAGPSEALGRYERYRQELRDELGSDPGTALQALHQELLMASEPPVRHGVAHEPNPLVGRDEDIDAVLDTLRTSRVTSVVGPGGIGKTRLAHAILRRAEQRAAYFVPLAGVTPDDDVVTQVASALAVGEIRTPAGSHRPPDAMAAIVDALGLGPALLVLDNCEHVIEEVATLVQALVSTAKDLRVLTTSRTPLDLSSESVYQLPELTLPSSIDLFEQRARAARPGVELPPDVVSELCRRLDGLPLAVELAAARVRAMSVAEIADRLDDRFTLLRGGPRDAPQRHRTLHAVVDWSWNLLDPAGQAAMRGMSLFPGGFTADAARVVLGDGDAVSVLEQLVDQSLLSATDAPSGTRFRMLEIVREFSAAHRDSAGERDSVTARFLAWARDFAMAHHDAAFGADPYLPVMRMRAEEDNLVQALRHGLARSDGATVAATTAVLGALWSLESNYQRPGALIAETSRLLSHFRPEPELVEVTRTALTIATAHTFVVERPRAVRTLVALRRLPPAPPDTMARAVAIVLASDESQLREATHSDEPLLAAVANTVASYGWQNEGDVDGALAAAERALTALEQRDVPWLKSQAHARLAELYLGAEHFAEAIGHLRAALPVYERLGTWADIVGVRWWMVLANLQAGDVDEAGRWLEQAIPDTAHESAGPVEYGLGVRAEIMLVRGEVEEGLRMWRDAVDGLQSSEDYILRPLYWEALAVAVVAHAYHKRLNLVEDASAELTRQLTGLLEEPAGSARPFVLEIPIYGAMLLALAMVELDRGSRSGDEGATTCAVRMIALAERFGYIRNFQPTMSSARAREAAEHANRPAYKDAVSSYAGLDRDALLAAARATLRSRPSSTSG